MESQINDHFLNHRNTRPDSEIHRSDANTGAEPLRLSRLLHYSIILQIDARQSLNSKLGAGSCCLVCEAEFVYIADS